MKKDIKNITSKGQLHGYNPFYFNNKLIWRSMYKNNMIIEYHESHGTFKETSFHIR